VVIKARHVRAPVQMSSFGFESSVSSTPMTSGDPVSGTIGMVYREEGGVRHSVYGSQYSAKYRLISIYCSQ